MLSIKNGLAVFAFCVFAAQVIVLPAQEDERNPNFKVAISQGIGWQGFNTSTQFMLVDEFGFRYDSMFLLSNDSVKQALKLSEEQREQIKASWIEKKKEMDARVVSAIASDSGRDEIERFACRSLFERRNQEGESGKI